LAPHLELVEDKTEIDENLPVNRAGKNQIIEKTIKAIKKQVRNTCFFYLFRFIFYNRGCPVA
jgi:hypothetical protein